MAGKLSWAWSQNAWYVADYAKSGRSTCKEFRCKKAIPSGELRVGIEAPEDDHRGNQLGWYHPACLWKTFTYKSNANKEITSLTQISGLDKLRRVDQAVFQALLDGKGSGQAPEASQPTSEVAAGLRRKVNVKIEGNIMTLTGPTFHIKEDLKKFGAKFDGGTKAWIITKQDNDSFEAVQAFLRCDGLDLSASSSPQKRQRTGS
mmetsp:Transcript_64875/g.152543  ORF Transcript_64875/g.152543 Transcript_64875/m.152543 type:complete len:204 (+) Transcript_64875:80-691(+)